MNRLRTGFSQFDYLIAFGIFAMAFVQRVPFRSAYAHHWDSAQFALAIGDYNVAISQPQAPGYFLYVMLGRLANSLVGDPQASLVWMSVLFGSGLAAVMYLLGAAMFDRRIGVAAGLFAMTSPQLWFHSCVALTYIVDAFAVCLTVLVCRRALDRGGTWGDALTIGVLLATVGGVRQQSAPAVVPLVAYTAWQFQHRRIAKLTTILLVAVVLSLAWFVPMVTMSGGLNAYLEATRRISLITASQTLADGGWSAVLWNIKLMAVYCWNGLTLAAVVLAGGLLYRTFLGDIERKRMWDREHAKSLWMLTLWVVPFMLFGTVLKFTEQPGHVLSYLPAFLLMAAVIVGQIRKPQLAWSAVAAVCAVNVVAFAFWPAKWDGIFFGVGRTAREIRQHDEQLGHVIRTIREEFRPADVVVCHALAAHYMFGLRLFQLHLPEFDHLQLQIDPTLQAPHGKPLLLARSGRTDFVTDIAALQRDQFVLVVPAGKDVAIFEPYFKVKDAIAVQNSRGMLFEVGADAVRHRSHETVQ